MDIELTEKESRVVGCLMEKSVITPDQYPLTLNALTNACNQKSSREPVMNLTPGEVQATVRSLESKRLVRVEENFRTQVGKYTQRLCNTPFSDFQFDPAQFAVMTVLLLRGPRTPGELRANVGRLHTFPENSDVLETLQTLRDRTGGALVAELPRTPGRRDQEWIHLLGAASARDRRPVPRHSSPDAVGTAIDRTHGDATRTPAPLETPAAALEARVAALEIEVAALRRRLEIHSEPTE